MSSRLQAAMLRRLELQAKIADQRDDLARLTKDFSPAFQIADQAVASAKFLRAHALLTGAVLGLAVFKRRGAAALFKGVWRIWKLYRYAAAALGEKRN